MPNAFPTVRHPLLSLLQSAAAAVARRQSPDASQLGPDGHPLTSAAAALATARQDPTRGYSPPANTSVSASTCAGLGLELLEALVAGDQAKQAEMRDRIGFSQCDPRWVETLTEYAADLQPDGKPRLVPYRRYTGARRLHPDRGAPGPTGGITVGLGHRDACGARRP